mgnify:CR=1 FL=1
MKYQPIVPILACLVCFGCSGTSTPTPGDTGATDTLRADAVDIAVPDAVDDVAESLDVADADVADADVADADDAPDATDADDATDTTVCNEFCLGACASRRFDAPTGECQRFVCDLDPAISGTPHPIPGGGWLLESSPNLCVTDTASWRLAMLSTDGTFSVLQQREINMMNADQTLPSLVAVQNDKYLLLKTGCPYDECREELAGQYATLSAYSFDSAAALWQIGGPELQNGNLASAVAVDSDRIWIASTQWNPGNVGSTHLVSVKFDGTVADTIEIPGDGWLKAFMADDDRILLVFRSTTTSESAQTTSVYSISIDRLGNVGGPTELKTITFSSSGSVVTRFLPMTSGMIGYYRIFDSATPPISPGTFVINLDGGRRWIHEGEWENGQFEFSWVVHEFDDSTIGYITPSGTEYRKISADGQSSTTIQPAIPPPVDGLNWGIMGMYFLDDGILAVGAASRNSPDNEYFIARYTGDFGTLKWVRNYGSSSHGGGLRPDGDGWLLWYDRCSPWIGHDGGEFSCGETCAGTYLGFDSICG